MKEDKVKVSVFCIAYNHERYIRKCLDSLVCQNTDFPFEIIVHDDASTDGTADIIAEYEEKYPELIRPIYQKENQYSQGVYIFDDVMLPAAQGKYIAMCEGDDFWDDEFKLQYQYDAMKAHPDCHLCVHRVKLVMEDGETEVGYLPSFLLTGGVLSSREAQESIIYHSFTHTTSFFFLKKDAEYYVNNYSDEKNLFPTNDEPFLLYLTGAYDVFYIDRQMSCYRLDANGSYTKNMLDHIIDHKERQIAGYRAYDTVFNNKYHDLYKYVIDKKHYDIAVIKRDYATIFRSAINREFLKNDTFQIRTRMYLGRYFPPGLKLYEFVKKVVKH